MQIGYGYPLSDLSICVCVFIRYLYCKHLTRLFEYEQIHILLVVDLYMICYFMYPEMKKYFFKYIIAKIYNPFYHLLICCCQIHINIYCTVSALCLCLYIFFLFSLFPDVYMYLNTPIQC